MGKRTEASTRACGRARPGWRHTGAARETWGMRSSVVDVHHRALCGWGCWPATPASGATHAHKARMGTRSIDVVRKWRHDWTIEGILRQPNQFAELKPTNRD